MKTTDMNYTPIQLKLPVDMERMIETRSAEKSQLRPRGVAPHEPFDPSRGDLRRDQGQPRIRTVPQEGHKPGDIGNRPHKLWF